MPKHNYVTCGKSSVPTGVRFDTMRSDAGQIVEVQYGAFGAAEAGPGAEYKRVVDHSTGVTTYYTLITPDETAQLESNRARNREWLATYDPAIGE